MCTNFSLFQQGTSANYTISARTMDFNVNGNSQVTVTPRGQSFPEMPPVNSPLKWQNQYGYVSMQFSLKTYKRASDGINEKGLSVGSLWLADAQYPAPESASAEKPALYNVDFCDWVLGNFDNIQALQTALQSVTVIPSTELLPTSNILVHYVATDSSGESLIIEYTNGTVQTYQSANGVMTNTPPYPWHLNNLVNYLPLSLENSPNEMWGGEVNGSGLLGMPGDYVSPNRFIRTWYLQQSTTQYTPQNLGEAVGLAARILQNCAMPIGSTKITTQGIATDEAFEYTQYAVIRDHKNLGYYFFTQFNNNLFFIDLTKIDFSKVSAAIPSVQPQWQIDITQSLIQVP
ncbi:linear amide C-N hydrolase [Nostoc sp. CHAB 5784]|uniref:linear amide C-N hydrolase n=1 Tax=Nostoc mirabile TaxID=2907820 RepID=UPI001E2C4E1D|nr:linear amide C-N hydrolase [Nostoc mirabile]MCC5666652.1 linear amide C-N hydrolase [Nostoc mirabile CHAB5784]